MKKVKKWMPRVFVTAWVLLLVALGGYYLLFAPTDSAYSETENRNLAAFPQLTVESLFSGKFGKDMETYLLDRFPMHQLSRHFDSRSHKHLRTFHLYR